jgi:exodeoxyribonuclease VII large subunit
VNVLIYPAQVQGETAAHEVSSGVRWFNRHGSVDVIIVARGGGSLEDLFAFNDEGLARTIAGSDIPVISAVGHETDFTICDFVADLRAPTPSAAAELVIRSKHELAEKVLAFHKRLTQAVNYKLLRANNALSNLVQHAVFARMQDSIARRQQRTDDLVYRLAQAQSRILKSQSRRLAGLEEHLQRHDLRVRTGEMSRQLDARSVQLETAMARMLVERHTHLNRLSVSLASAGPNLILRRRSHWERVDSQLEALSPKAILARGYALVFDKKGQLVKQASQLKPGDQVRTQLSSGEFTSKVERVKNESG